jgi:hypothetical protein
VKGIGGKCADEFDLGFDPNENILSGSKNIKGKRSDFIF